MIKCLGIVLFHLSEYLKVKKDGFLLLFKKEVTVLTGAAQWVGRRPTD